MAQRKSKRSGKQQPRQRELFRRGGKRRGAGRKSRGARAGERHQARPDFKPYHALHVVVRVAPAVGSLRCRKLYKAMRDATITAALREWFRIVHISLQRNHVHLLVEAEHKAALSRGMQGFLISAARHINTALGDGARRRRGKVFSDRYHVEVITTPTRTRHAISYILGNWRKHGEDQAELPSTWLVDPFSSAIMFPDWQELEGQPCMWPIREATIHRWCGDPGPGCSEKVGSAQEVRSAPGPCRASRAEHDDGGARELVEPIGERRFHRLKHGAR